MKILKYLLLLLLFISSVCAKAQVRTEGSFSFKKYNQVQIEAALELAFTQGRLTNNFNTWQKLMPTLLKYRQLQKSDFDAFSSLRDNFYFIDETQTKTFIVYLAENQTFYLARVVQCQEVPALQHGNRCRLGITKILPVNGAQFELDLSKHQKKNYLAEFYNIVICSGKVKI